MYEREKESCDRQKDTEALQQPHTPLCLIWTRHGVYVIYIYIYTYNNDQDRTRCPLAGIGWSIRRRRLEDDRSSEGRPFGRRKSKEKRGKSTPYRSTSVIGAVSCFLGAVRVQQCLAETVRQRTPKNERHITYIYIYMYIRTWYIRHGVGTRKPGR